MNQPKIATNQYNLAPAETAATGRLWLLSGDQQGREYALEQTITTIGRGASNNIVIADPQTSRRHLDIVRVGQHYQAIDAGSANGFYINERLMTRAILLDGDIITIGLVKIAFYQPTPAAADNLTPAPDPTHLKPDNPAQDEAALQTIDLHLRPVTSFGREPGLNQIVLDNPQVSRRHFEINQPGTNFTIGDSGSTNGTYVNGGLIEASPIILNDGDIIVAGPYRFRFANGFLYRSQDDSNLRIDVLGLSKQSKSGATLLHNLSFTILPREFVAIVGGSGAGKSTLLDAISGVRPASSGAVLYNGSDYYSRLEVYNSTIGYVPQDDIVPTELTVYKALYYAARLRLPHNTSLAEIKARLEEVLDDLDLTNRRHTPIHQLSGGQRKRVSIGAELLSRPSLFFLDEPTSGLDPGLEGRMMQLLRKLADQGRTVVLVTHATQNLDVCDQLLFLAQGGYIAFYGTPANALDYFGVTRFSEIYSKLETEKTSPEWAAAFQASPYYERNIASRLRAVASQTNNPVISFRRPGGQSSAWRQFAVLTARYREVLWSDRRYLTTLLMQAPVVALMMLLVFGRSDFEASGGDFGKAKTLVFLLVMVAVWFGTSNAAREIVKENPVYRRERRVGLKIAPYICSKLAIQGGLVLIQVLSLTLLVGPGLGLGGGSWQALLYIYLTLSLTAFTGVTMGLLISALTTNSDRATGFVPVALIPQIIFSGAIVSLDKMGAIGGFVSQFVVARWGYQAVGTLANLESIPSPRLRFNGPPPEFATQIEKLFNGGIKYQAPDWYLIPGRDLEFEVNLALHWLIPGLIISLSLILIFIFQWRKDQNYK